MKGVVPKLTSGMHKVRAHVHYKHSLTRDKESDLLHKVKSVVLKLTTGMHKVRFIDKYSMTSAIESDLLQKGKCRPQAYQLYLQGKSSSKSSPC